LQKSYDWSLKQCFFLKMGGFVIQNDSPAGGVCHRVHPDELLKLFRSNALDWPTSSDADINDRSKADWITKGLALLQIVWFITQLIGRWAQGLAVTTLELFTLGIVVCATVIYIALWEKPFDVQMPVVLQANCSTPERHHIDSVKLTYNSKFDKHSWVVLAGFAICLGFGAIHLGAWDFHFPSLAEQLLWRISSIACIMVPLLIFLFYRYFSYDLRQSIGDIPFLVVAFLYLLSRVYMFVEMFVSLRAAPASVYQTPQWSQYFPSFG
jgi:hypothetical protein